MKPPTETTCKLRRKLQELAERGIDGEKVEAARKLVRLEARYDFTQPEPGGADLFGGTFERSATAQFLSSYQPAASEIGNFTKWAIETRAKIPCLWRYRAIETELWAEATGPTLIQLRHIAAVIRENFAQLWQEFAVAPGIDGAERPNFFLGLYDGMMDDRWQQGKPLPAVHREPAKRDRRKRVLSLTGVALHPYSIALDLGRRIRLSIPLGEIVAELQGEIRQLKTAA